MSAAALWNETNWRNQRIDWHSEREKKNNNRERTTDEDIAQIKSTNWIEITMNLYATAVCRVFDMGSTINTTFVESGKVASRYCVLWSVFSPYRLLRIAYKWTTRNVNGHAHFISVRLLCDWFLFFHFISFLNALVLTLLVSSHFF